MKKYLAIDLGGTKLAVSLFNDDKLVDKISEATLREGNDTVVPEQIIRMSADIIAKNKLSFDGTSGVGVSSCGPFIIKNGNKFLAKPYLCGGLTGGKYAPNEWKEIPLESVLKKTFPGVVIQNDCVAAVKAEKMFGAGKESDNFVYVTWSTGLGTGAIVDGHLISGKNGNAPHLGHIIVTKEDQHLCGCGQYGHMEGEVAGGALGRQYGERATAKEVFEKYRKGEDKAIKIVERAVDLFSLGLASMNAILDNEFFSIGGSVFTENKDILLPKIKEKFAEHAYVPLGTGVQIIESPLGERIADYGALSLVINA